MRLTVRRIFYIYRKAQIHLEGRYAVYFTNGDHRAFESLMQDRPGSDHYDSGVDGPYPECRECREHQPYRRDRFCRYVECPFTPGRSTARAGPGKGGEAQTGKSVSKQQDN